MTRAEELQRMARAWRALPERDRAIFGTVRFEGLDYVETARRHSCTVEQVEGTIVHVLVALDQAMTDDRE